MVCGFAFAFVACGGGSTESTEATEGTEMTEDAATMEEPAAEEPAMDSVASDTTSMQ